MADPTWSWRDQPILEALLRLERLHQDPTAENIADEAILHLGDVYDGLAHLATAGYLDLVTVMPDTGAPTTLATLRIRVPRRTPTPLSTPMPD